MKFQPNLNIESIPKDLQLKMWVRSFVIKEYENL